MIGNVVSVGCISLLLCACGSGGSQTDASDADALNKTAMITAVNYTGEPGNYNFSVTVRSADTGCNQYADWWEVVKDDGTLVYRRVLTHSHVNEQPFTRTGGPVSVLADENLIVRAHMNSTGYGTTAFTGSIQDGFAMIELDSLFAIELESLEPLPVSCAF